LDPLPNGSEDFGCYVGGILGLGARRQTTKYVSEYRGIIGLVQIIEALARAFAVSPAACS
jgi:hypothetical protein